MSINRKQSIIIMAVAAAVIIIFTVLGIFINPKNNPEELTTEADSAIFEEVSSEAIEEESSEPVVTTEPSTETPTTEKATEAPTVEKTTQKPVTTTKKPVTTTVPETTEAVEPTPTNRYFDVPLSHDLQDHIFRLCNQYGVSPALVIAIIEKESGFNPDAVNYNGTCFGLMQVYKNCHTQRMYRLGVIDLFNPYQNVIVGIDILAELYSSGNSTYWVLTQYSGGSTSYANSVMNRAAYYGG